MESHVRRMPPVCGVLLLLCLLVSAFPAAAAEMTVSAAASLTNAFTELAALFEKKHAGLTVHVNFAASNPLLRQLQEGAPVDVFASADQATMDKAVAAGVVNPASRRNFARNDLVLVAPKAATVPAGLGDLGNCRKIALGNPESVPAGRYAREALTTAGLWDVLHPKYIFGNSVRQVLDYVARGEVDAGFVYRTDALQFADKVDVIKNTEGHEPVSYPIAVATTGGNAVMGQTFLDFVLSPEGQAVLAGYGFSGP